MNIKLREDIFVSVCCVFDSDQGQNYDTLKNISGKLSDRFRYWEIIVGVSAEGPLNINDILSSVPNLRLLEMRSGTPFYRCRVAIASEAIGDVVLLTSPDEMSVVDPIDFLESAHSKSAIIVGRRERGGFANPMLRMLGRGAGFHVDERDTLTVAYPRTILNQILVHPDRQLALRFPPAARSIPVVWKTIIDNKRQRPIQALRRRLGLIQKLIISSAPNVLTLVSLVSFVVMAIAIMFACYALGVWFTLSEVQPGWLTTSLALSLTAEFLACAIFGLSIGLQKIIEALSTDTTNDIVGEQGAADMFDGVFHQLNVDIEDRSVIEVAGDTSHQENGEPRELRQCDQ